MGEKTGAERYEQNVDRGGIGAAKVKIQYLVLDDDAHKPLKARKKSLGLTVKEIGNSALRTALAVPTKKQLIVAKLAVTGKTTREDYAQAMAVAEKET